MSTKIALTNLGKYNEGELVFTWLSVPFTSEELEEAFDKIEVASNTEYEEYFISDYETDIEGLKIHEYENLDELNDLLERIESLDSYEVEVLEAIIEARGESLESALETIEKSDYIYYSNIYSYEELAEQFVEEGLFGEIPEHLASYIDYEKIGRDLKYDYVKTSKGFIRFD